MAPHRGFFDADSENWRQKLDHVVETMREMSLQVDPQAMVRAYGARMRQIMPSDRFVSLSRRDMEPPKYRITRTSLWSEEINPWKEKGRLPVLEGGSLIAMPNYDHGVAMNMVLMMRKGRSAFRREQFPEMVWLSNLFGRATQNLVLSEEVKRAYDIVDRELKVVADIQRSLHASLSSLQWVVDAYSLMLASFLLTAGSLGDRLGRRRVFTIGFGVFTFASFLCGISDSPTVLNLCRGLQGVGGAGMFATALALLSGAFSGKERGTAFAFFGAKRIEGVKKIKEGEIQEIMK